MDEPIRIRFGGYSPPDSSHSRAAVHFKEALGRSVGQRVQVDHFWNVLDFGYRADDLLSMVECGLLTMCYFSTSYLADRVPELEIIDLPFIFENEAHAHAALDGKLERDGIAFVDLTAAERSAFTEAVQPVLRDARKRLGNTILAMAAST